jgi:hypothetical protein
LRSKESKEEEDQDSKMEDSLPENEEAKVEELPSMLDTTIGEINKP